MFKYASYIATIFELYGNHSLEISKERLRLTIMSRNNISGTVEIYENGKLNLHLNGFDTDEVQILESVFDTIAKDLGGNNDRSRHN